jgi:chaperone required for assembly of F1-ATPase
MKRFWRSATAEQRDGSWQIMLDGKPMRLPGGPVLRLEHPALAAALAEEWHAAGGQVGGIVAMEDVPLTRLAGTAQHRIAPDPAPTVAALARYAESDCLCYRAAHPEVLAVRQHHAWQKWLDWAATSYGARLVITHGIMAVQQPEQACAALAAAVGALDAWRLAGMGILVPAYGSLVLGLAVAAGRLSAAEAHTLSVLDELFQEEKWGQDADAVARRGHVVRDVTNAERFMRLMN